MRSRFAGEGSSSAGASPAAVRSPASTCSRGSPERPTRSATRSSRSPTTSSCPRARRRRIPTTTPARSPEASQQPYLEPISLAAWLLAATRRIRVAISVLVVPYRNPVVTAKQLATIDVMSGGRLIVGVGVGWWPEEFEALAAPPFAERGAGDRRVHPPDEDALDEGLSALRGQVLPDRRRHDAAPAGPEAAPADLGRRPHRAGAPPDGTPGRRVASDRAPRSRRPGARRAGREDGADPDASPGRPGATPRRSASPSGAPSIFGRPGEGAGAEAAPPAGRPARQGGRGSPRLPGRPASTRSSSISRSRIRRPWSR